MGSHRSPAERLADLEDRKKKVDERIAALSAREKVRQRKDDDRRCMILGSIVLADLATQPSVAKYIKARLPNVLRDADRRLFIELLDGDAS